MGLLTMNADIVSRIGYTMDNLENLKSKLQFLRDADDTSASLKLICDTWVDQLSDAMDMLRGALRD